MEFQLSYLNPKRWCCESATLNMPANLEKSAVATGLVKVSFHSNPRERQCQRMLKLPHNCTHSHASKGMLSPLPFPKVCPKSCPLYWWCHPATLSSDTLFFCLQSFPASGTFPMSQLFESGDQNTEASASASASVLPTSVQGWFQDWLVWSPCCPRDSEESSPASQLEGISS